VKVPPSWAWFVLFLPFGVSAGYVATTIGWIGTNAGMSPETIGALVALNILPHTWKFFWAPVSDMTFTRKRWYLASNLAGSAAFVAMSMVPFTPAGVARLEIVIFANSLAMTFLGMAVEGLMAHTVPPDHRGRAAGWFQAGNLGGAGVGGGIGLLVAQYGSPSASALAMAAMTACCSFPLLLIREPAHDLGGETWPKAVAAVGRDLFQTVATRKGAFTLFLCFLPLGAGAAAGMFSTMAHAWSAGPKLVAATTGILGGVVAAAGCLVGGWMSDRMNRKGAYAIAGVIVGVVAAGMALAPRSPFTYGLFTLAYSFASGLTYGSFTGFVLETIGKGAAATKYNAFASLSNVPIWYMTRVDASVLDDWGPWTMLLTDAGSALIGLVLVGLALAVLRPRVAPTT
jgi:MFS family permease